MHDPESPWEPKKYRQWFRCPDCGHKYASKWEKAPPKYDVPCPRKRCAQARELKQTQIENQRLRAMLEEQRAPAHIGASNVVKAIDFTAETTMQTYGMTDLKDSIREGESMAPKLPGGMQAAADGYFKQDQPVRAVDFGTNRMRTIQAKQLDLLGKRAIAGSFRHRAVTPNAVAPPRLKVNDVFGPKG